MKKRYLTVALILSPFGFGGLAWYFQRREPPELLIDLVLIGSVVLTIAVFVYLVFGLLEEDPVHVNTGTIDPVEKRDLNEEQELSKQPVQTEVVDYEHWKHWAEVDLPTAAAIWSGSWDVGNAFRHVCFRNLKWAINNGYLAAAKLKGGKANIKSTVRPLALKSFFDQWDTIRNSQPLHDPRVGLSQLRKTGVELRNEAHTMDPDYFCNQVNVWAQDVYDEIENIDPADAGYFATLDLTTPPRINPPQPLTDLAEKSYRELDFMLVKLEKLILKYGSKN